MTQPEVSTVTRYWFDIKPAHDSPVTRNFRVQAADWDKAVNYARHEAAQLWSLMPPQVFIIAGGIMEPKNGLTDAQKSELINRALRFYHEALVDDGIDDPVYKRHEEIDMIEELNYELHFIPGH